MPQSTPPRRRGRALERRRVARVPAISGRPVTRGSIIELRLDPIHQAASKMGRETLPCPSSRHRSRVRPPLELRRAPCRGADSVAPLTVVDQILWLALDPDLGKETFLGSN